jgi:LysM repeat protein
MNHQETPDPQIASGHENDPQPLPSAPPIFSSPDRGGRHRPLAGRPARVLLISAAVSAALLAASAGVSALVASDGGSPAAAVGQPAALEQPAPATSSAAAATAAPPAASAPARALAAAPATTAQAKAPVKAAAKPPTKVTVKAPAKATVKAPVKTATVRKVAPAPAPKPATYRVVAGDTVSAIAARFNVSMGGVLAANGLGPSSVIVPGQTLKLSGPAVSAPAPAQAPALAPAPRHRLLPQHRLLRCGPSMWPAPAARRWWTAASAPSISRPPTDTRSSSPSTTSVAAGPGSQESASVSASTFRATARTGSRPASQVPNPGTTNDVAAVFGGFPRAVLQTCIPGTTQMLVIALN